MYASENQRNITIAPTMLELCSFGCPNYIHHKCAHPDDNARPTVLSNAINFVNLVYLLCIQQAAC